MPACSDVLLCLLPKDSTLGLHETAFQTRHLRPIPISPSKQYSSSSFILHQHEQSITISTTTPSGLIASYLSSRIPTRYLQVSSHHPHSPVSFFNFNFASLQHRLRALKHQTRASIYYLLARFVFLFSSSREISLLTIQSRRTVSEYTRKRRTFKLLS